MSNTRKFLIAIGVILAIAVVVTIFIIFKPTQKQKIKDLNVNQTTTSKSFDSKTSNGSTVDSDNPNDSSTATVDAPEQEEIVSNSRTLISETQSPDYVLNEKEEKAGGEQPLDNDHYQQLINEKSLVQANARYGKADSAPIAEKLSAMINEIPKRTSSAMDPEYYAYEDVIKKYGKANIVMRDLQTLIQMAGVNVGTVNATNTANSSEQAFDAILIDPETGAQNAYISGYYKPESGELQITTAFLVRDGVIRQNGEYVKYAQINLN